MATRKNLMVVPRRVWRMTTDAPLGEYLELVPKEVQAQACEAPKQPSRSDRTIADGAVSLPAVKRDSTQPTPSTRARSQQSPSNRPARPDDVTGSPTLPRMRTKVLTPAQVENWQASSFDLFTGCTVREVTDTIPGELFDELFATEPAPSTLPKRRP